MIEASEPDTLVDRPRLRERLDRALHTPVTLVVAQAGAGKTVLLRQWTAQCGAPTVAWVDLETADDDPVRLARRILTALDAVRPGVAPLSSLSGLHGGGLGTTLIDSLALELRDFPETLIVLDDLHRITNPTLVADLGRLGAELPGNVHLILSSRVDPAVAWSRLRLRGGLLEIRQSDLALSDEEAAELLHRVTGRDVPADIRTLLLRRTEGWAAGIQLAGLGLRYREADALAFAETFAGTDRMVADYLTEEVLAALPADDRTLLLELAVLEVMTTDLVGHVLDRDDAGVLLERLAHESLFVVPLEPGRTRFRFHHLFRDLLRHHLRVTDPGAEARLLGRAADFHLARGEMPDAIEALLRAEDWPRAIEAIMTTRSEVFERGEMRTVIRWISSVPESARADRLDVSLELAMLIGMEGDAITAVDLLSRIAADPRATVGKRASAHAWISATAQWASRPEESIHAADTALELLDAHPDARPKDVLGLTSPAHLRTLAIGSSGRARFLAGDLDDAQDWLERALDADAAHYVPFRVALLGSLALLHAWRGRRASAGLLASEALDAADHAGLLAHPSAADAYLARARSAVLAGRPSAAEVPLVSASLRSEANRRTQLTWIGRAIDAARAVAEGRTGDALAAADVDGRLGLGPPAPAVHDELVAVHMLALRHDGRTAEALHVCGPDAASRGPAARYELLAALIGTGRLDEAGDLLATWAPPDASTDPLRAVQHLLAHAAIAELEGRHGPALASATRALDAAEPEGIAEPFAQAEGPISSLLAELAVTRSGLVDRALERRLAEHPLHANGDLAEPLTQRELEVLALLPEHATSVELAGRCYVSVNTLKTHLAHIYRKLGVSGRSAAIARARELGLLPAVSPRPALER
ncbi:transcriptional regulator [Agromyces rhizosphaerae]|uniref:Transcriptional regulator n=1 Tax=Agromyces rhizosphaerae TaxID=88374 RepID=A0A9W6FNP6_9MICO|nr:LuxR C-terminal-related transcriptional regulator [Agromyces rhizosphaerae]GLI27194.1 transcriptional regulator [Agromyces rhizosphaerae]